MDKGRRASHSNRGPGESPPICPRQSDITFDPWHSTPVKKHNYGAPVDACQVSITSQNEMDGMSRQPARSAQPFPTETHCFQDIQTQPGQMECATILRQRRELQLLIAELKDRDRELNTMAASHHKQLQAWEQDRQRVLTLEQRCTRLDDELQKRNEVIRLLAKRAQVVETREKEVQRELSVAQQQLHTFDQKQQDFEDKNQSLNSTVMALSSQVGSLQVREEELRAMLKLKDKDVTEATAHIVDLTGRLRELETSQKESRSRESKLLRDLEESKRRYREAGHGNSSLKEELQLQVTQSSAQREEIIRLKQEGQLLRRDLSLTGEGESWKDELLVLARSKQERTESELHYLRQVCENQQNDLQLLQLNLDSAREALKEKVGQGSLGREAILPESVNFVGTDGEENSLRRQARSRISKSHQNAQEPIATTERHWQREKDISDSGLSFDVTDEAMTASELISNSTTNMSPLGQSSGGKPLSESRENHSTSSCLTPSHHTGSIDQASQGKESIDSLSCGTTVAQRNRTSQVDSSSCLFPGNKSTAPNGQDQLSGGYESHHIQQEEGRSRTESMETLSVTARSTEPSAQRSEGQVSLSGHSPISSRQGKAGGRVEQESSPSSTSGQNVDHASIRREDTGNGGVVRMTIDFGSLVESSELSGRVKMASSGHSEIGERKTGSSLFNKTSCGSSSISDMVGCQSGTVELGQTEPNSSKTASCGGSGIEQIGPNCGNTFIIDTSSSGGCNVVGHTEPSRFKTASCGRNSEASYDSCKSSIVAEEQTGLNSLKTGRVEDQAGPSSFKTGSVEDQAGPSSSKTGSVEDRAGPSSFKTGSVEDQAGPSSFKTGSVEDQAGPSSFKTGSVEDQAGPSSFKTGGVKDQAGPSSFKTGSVKDQAGPSSFKTGSVEDQAGPSSFKTGSVEDQAGPSSFKTGSVEDQAGPSSFKTGSVEDQAGPSSFKTASVEDQAGPSSFKTGSVEDQAGPSSFKTGSVEDQAGPSSFKTGSVEDQAGPSSFKTGSVEDQAGPSSFKTASVEDQAGPSSFKTGSVEDQAGPSSFKTASVEDQAGPSSFKTGSVEDQAGPSSFKTGSVEDQAGPSSFKTVDVEDQAGPSSFKTGSVEDKAGPSSFKTGGVKDQAGPSSFKTGSVKDQAGPSSFKTGSVEDKAGPSSFKTGGVKDQAGPSSFKTGSVKDQAGPSSFKTGSVEDQAGPSSFKTGSVEDQTGSSSFKTGSVEDQAGPSSFKTGSVEDQAGPSSFETGSVEDQAGPNSFKTVDVEELTGPSSHENVSCDCSTIADTTSCKKVCECTGVAGGAGGQTEAGPSGSCPTHIPPRPGAGMELVAVFNGGDFPVLLLDISPRTQQSSDYTCQDDLTCGCLDNPSPSSLRVRSPRPVKDVASLPTTNQRSVVNSDLGFFSAASKDGDQPSSSTCCLQRLLDESRQMVASLERTTLKHPTSSHCCDTATSLNISQDGRTTVSPRSSHTCQSSPHLQTSPTRKGSETPPKACLLHRTYEPGGQ